jgi:4-amino-4-deoxy-L-arabinose transferase-like glycosyltransferase
VQPDEGRYAEIPRQMLASGDWTVPQLNGLPYVEKPPLQYWATAAAYAVFGVHDWVSRLWNLLLGVAGVVAVGAAGHRLFGARAGWYAALVLMSAPLYLLVGQINLLDMGLTFFLTAALLCFVLAQQDLRSSHFQTIQA